ncbi:MAG: hypothetical protein KAX27_04170 [Candidatus Aminicenantes bacterium]|nr:hypothetical protein [Candidatus Aminicenantes bacterium]
MKWEDTLNILKNQLIQVNKCRILPGGSAKDFVDLFFLLKNSNHNFEDILKFVIKKYGVENRYEYHLKTSFAYFDDAEKEIDNIMLIKEAGKIIRMPNKEWNDIKQFYYEFIK